uniref:(California timema) hypothetical protein n=1 Tax=Timema californicum TaxID=61474 RepID=A0A7R9J0P8_TIMCA|nr:unnamed protein product [Timema californicum]
MLTLVLFVGILGLILYKLTSKPKNFPPGPFRWPLIGNVLKFKLADIPTHLVMQDLKRSHGNVAGFFMANNPMVLVSGLAEIREALAKPEFQGRPISEVNKMEKERLASWPSSLNLTYSSPMSSLVLTDSSQLTSDSQHLGMVFTDGDIWRDTRRFTLRHLREMGMGKHSMEEQIQEESRALMMDAKRMAGDDWSQPVPVHDLIAASGVNIILQLIAGYSTTQKRGGSEENNWTPENIDCLSVALARSPRKLAGQHSVELGLSNLTMIRILKNDLYYHSYKIQEVQDLKPQDYNSRSKMEELIPHSHSLAQLETSVVAWLELSGIWSVNRSLRRLLSALKIFERDDPRMSELMNLVKKLTMKINTSGGLASSFPILLRVFPWLTEYPAFKAIRDEIRQYCQEMINDHEKKLDENDASDFLDTYLIEMKKKGETSTFNTRQLIGVVSDLFIAGSDTTTGALAYGILNMVLNPNIQNQIQDEIDAVVGRERLPSSDDRIKMPYTDATINEILRFANVAPLVCPSLSTHLRQGCHLQRVQHTSGMSPSEGTTYLRFVPISAIRYTK